jgi:hypothetical protein
MAEGDATILAEVADDTHRIADARLRAWHLEETLWAANGPSGEVLAGSFARLREIKADIESLVDRRKQLGFPVPEGCQAWWTDYEVHGGILPSYLPTDLATIRK